MGRAGGPIVEFGEVWWPFIGFGLGDRMVTELVKTAQSGSSSVPKQMAA
jgi:hypothetical protein